MSRCTTSRARSSSSLRLISSQFCSLPSMCAGTSDQRPFSRLPCRSNVSWPFALLLEQLVGAVVPDLDRPAAVLALRDLAVERRVLERVILDVHGERLRAGLERHALRHGPRRERAVPLEPEVVVQARRVVALHDEDRLLAALASSRTARASAWGRACAVLAEGHVLRSFALRGCLALGLRFRLLLRRGDRLAQRLHQVDDLAAFVLLRLGQRLALRLLLQQVEQLRAVAVVVAAPDPTWRRGSRSASSPSRPRPRAPAASAPPPASAPRRRSTSSRARACRRPARIAARCCLLRITTLAIATRPVSSSALTSRRYGFSAPSCGSEVVGLAEVDRVDLVDRDEVADVDRVGELDVEAVDVLVGQLDEAALVDLEARGRSRRRRRACRSPWSPCRSRSALRSRLSRKWNFSSFDSVAVNIRTGTETSPKEMTPVQIERGTPGSFPQAARTGKRGLTRDFARTENAESFST